MDGTNDVVGPWPLLLNPCFKLDVDLSLGGQCASEPESEFGTMPYNARVDF
jgi:hypothetical protein